MNTFQDIHAAETANYVRGLVQDLYRSEQAYVLIYSRQPGANALEAIATERATALRLLRDAIDNGLLTRLAAEKADKDVAAATEAGLFEQPDPASAAAYRRLRNEEATDPTVPLVEQRLRRADRIARQQHADAAPAEPGNEADL